MDYGERFNYGKIKDDFGYPNDKGYYSSTHTSFDSIWNNIPSLDDLQKEYPDKLKTYRWGRGNQFFATYGLGSSGDLELLDTNWYENMPMGNKELKEENEILKKYIDYLKEKNDNLKKKFKENIKKNSENRRKAKAFDKLYKILFGKFSYHEDYEDYYAFAKNIKIGQYLKGRSLNLDKLSDCELVSLINTLLEGSGAEYRIEWFGYSGLSEPDNGGTYAVIKFDEKDDKDKNNKK